MIMARARATGGGGALHSPIQSTHPHCQATPPLPVWGLFEAELNAVPPSSSLSQKEEKHEGEMKLHSGYGKPRFTPVLLILQWKNPFLWMRTDNLKSLQETHRLSEKFSTHHGKY